MSASEPGVPLPEGSGPERPEPGGLEIHAAHASRRLDAAHVEAIVEAVCHREGVRVASLSIVLADRETVWAVNRDWLDHDVPTDVVSFVLDEAAQARGEIDGEIYVDLDMAAERAPEFGVTPEHEALRYVAHGLLHLAGHDDATDAERAAMRALEDLALSHVDP